MAIRQAPLIFALKHLRLEWDSDKPTASARLMQGDREIPPVPEARVRIFLSQAVPVGKLPEDFELEMLEIMMAGLPREAKLSFDGISKFGAKRTEDAARCAYEALRLNEDCTLARQLLSLLIVKSEVRCPFGGGATNVPDVPEIVRREIVGAS